MKISNYLVHRLPPPTFYWPAVLNLNHSRLVCAIQVQKGRSIEIKNVPCSTEYGDEGTVVPATKAIG